MASYIRFAKRKTDIIESKKLVRQRMRDRSRKAEQGIRIQKTRNKMKEAVLRSYFGHSDLYCLNECFTVAANSPTAWLALQARHWAIKNSAE